MNKLLLVDANNLTMRAWMVPHPEMSMGEVETGTLVIFINMLARHVRIEQPDRAVVCWDGGGSAYRLRIFPDYKASRKAKATDASLAPFTLIHRFLQLAGFPQLWLPGYEGDDLIAAYWRACRGHQRICILSGDKDMFQLLEDGTEQLRPTSGQDRPDRWTHQRLLADKGYSPRQSILIMALMGDNIDGIPGLVRVGPKTAIKMLQKYDWDIDKLIENLPVPDQAIVLRNLALVDLGCVPLELDIPPTMNLVGPDDPRWSALEQFLDRYGLSRIRGHLLGGTLWS